MITFTSGNIRMTPPQAPHLRTQYPLEICPTVAKALEAEGCISPFAIWNGIEIVDPYYGATYLLSSGIVQYLRQSRSFLVMKPDGRYAEGTEAELCDLFVDTMARLFRAAGGREFCM